MKLTVGFLVLLLGSTTTEAALAQAAPPQTPPAPVNPAAQMAPYEYGPIISNANAKKVADAALAEAKKSAFLWSLRLPTPLATSSIKNAKMERSSAAPWSRRRRRALRHSTSGQRKRSRRQSLLAESAFVSFG